MKTTYWGGENVSVILAVDKDIVVHEQQTAEWAKLGVDTIRVDSMHEAIKRLAHNDDYLFIAINEDTIPDYTMQIPIIRDVTNKPIFVITSSYTNKKKTFAISLGVDVYDPFNNYAKDDVLGALELLKLKDKWSNRLSVPLPLLVAGDIILSRSRQCVFVKDVEVSLTKKEFDILEYLMINKGQFLTHSQILRKVWGDEYEEASHDVIWNSIKRLREKLSASQDSNDNIESKREVGYRFVIKQMKK
jgi:two-component system alkaline phosphatase synthesis response regulator PhoP